MGWGFAGGIAESLRGSLYRNAFYLMLNTAVASLMGAVFWLVAARFYPESEVGLAAALIPMALFIAAIGTLGLPMGLIRFLPEAAEDPERSRRMVNTSMTLGALVAMAVGVVFVLGIEVWAPSLLFVRVDPLFFLAFVLFCGIFAVGPTIDAVAIAYRKAQFVLGRNAVFQGLRAALPLIFVGVFGVFGLFFSFVLAAFVGAVVALILFLPRLVVWYRPVPTMRLSTLRPLFGFSLGNHAAGLLGMIAPSVLPLLVLELRSPVENAWFYVAWFLGSILYVVPAAFSMSLYAEGSQPDRDLPRDIRRTILGSTLLLVPAGLFLYFYGDWLLTIFGETYATGGFELLRWLVLAAPFVLVNTIYLTLVRVEKRVGPLIAVAAFISLFAVGGSWFLLSTYGLPGVGIAWFFSQGFVSLSISIALATGRGPF